MPRSYAWTLPTAQLWTALLIVIILLLGGNAIAGEDPAVTDLIDLNRATVVELMTLPGIGEERARDIVAFRSRRPFRRRLDLLRVRGIGRGTYLRLRSLIRVVPAPRAAKHSP